jgi:hypothetical protein
MTNEFPRSFFRSILPFMAFYGFILNTIWEFIHAGWLYDMWQEVTLLKGLIHIFLAIFGDVLIVVAISMLALLVCGRSDLYALGFKSCLCMVLTGFIAGLFLEWIPQKLDWWTYNDLMPAIQFMDESVGLSPLLQITFLPFISVLLAIKVGNPLTLIGLCKSK